MVDRMRAAALVERAPMVDRIPQDAFAGIVSSSSMQGGGVVDDQERHGKARSGRLQAP